MDLDEKELGSRLRRLSREKSKKERWIKTRMWFSTFLSYIYPDMGYIPENLGNNILIVNNRYITKNSISAVIILKEFSEMTPISYMSEVIKEVKSRVPGVTVDFTLKTYSFKVDTRDKGLENRVLQWIKTLSNTRASERTKTRAARLLYTYDVAMSGEKLFKTHAFVTLRATDGSKSAIAIKALRSVLAEFQTEHKVVKSNMKNMLEYITSVSDRSSGRLKEIPYSIQSALTIAEMLPSIQGLNDSKGLYMGISRQNRAPYHIDFRASASGKNIYVVAPSGQGKTFLVQNWLLDGTAIDFNICMMDLKGTDYEATTESLNGVSLSMRSSSTKYVNFFKMYADQCDEDPVLYFNERFKLAKMQLLILANLKAEEEAAGEVLIEEFLNSLYENSLGAIPENPNTWYRTLSVTPYDVYNYFEPYARSTAVISTFGKLAGNILKRLKMYMSTTGSSSHMFKEEYNIHEVLKTKALRFDFGMLESGRQHDISAFKLRVLFMRYINDEYVRYKKSLGQWVIKVLEESQVAEDYLLEMYVEEMTLRRAQNQVTILLGNSTSAIQDNPIARPLLDNINILAIGAVPKTSREFLVEEYGLEDHVDKLESIYKDSDYENTFLLVNRMQKNSTVALLKVYVPTKVARGRIFKNVDTEE